MAKMARMSKNIYRYNSMSMIRRRYLRIMFCNRCQGYDFAEREGPYFWRCTECMGMIPAELGQRVDHGYSSDS